MFIIMLRTLVLYFTVVIFMRMMGKKQIGQLQPFELAVTIMISELASLPMQDTRIPLVAGIIPIVILLVLQTILSFLELKSEKARLIINGKPSILIHNGQIDIEQLKKQGFNIDDLMEELRLKGYYNLEDIQFAILETSGQMSIIPKTELTNLTKSDMNIKVSQDNIPITLIMDGKVNYENLKIARKDIKWLQKKLEESNTSSYKDVFIALIDSKGKFYFQPKVKK